MRIYDLTNLVEEYSDKDKIYDSIEANMYYKDKSKSPKSPTEILMKSDKAFFLTLPFDVVKTIFSF